MATKFLRKIIMEELQKVLEEKEIPGTEPGQIKSPSVKNKDRELDLGDTTFTVKKKAFDKRVYDLQQDLNATGKYNLATDGILGSETMKAVRKETGWRGTPQDMLAKVSKVRGQLQGAIADFMRKSADKAVGAAGNMEYAKTKLASSLSGAASDTSASPQKGPLPTETMTPEEKQELMRLKPLNLNRESIVRELEKLLRNI